MGEVEGVKMGESTEAEGGKAVGVACASGDEKETGIVVVVAEPAAGSL